MSDFKPVDITEVALWVFNQARSAETEALRAASDSTAALFLQSGATVSIDAFSDVAWAERDRAAKATPFEVTDLQQTFVNFVATSEGGESVANAVINYLLAVAVGSAREDVGSVFAEAYRRCIPA
ncbi:MAG: hypothetical protein J0H96_13030 [Microbacterium ginsengisoli]|nr:hypothetical protein [Microbacterium ginsengisoli]